MLLYNLSIPLTWVFIHKFNSQVKKEERARFRTQQHKEHVEIKKKLNEEELDKLSKTKMKLTTPNLIEYLI
jgi:hypothetical protein